MDIDFMFQYLRQSVDNVPRQVLHEGKVGLYHEISGEDCRALPNDLVRTSPSGCFCVASSAGNASQYSY